MTSARRRAAQKKDARDRVTSPLRTAWGRKRKRWLDRNRSQQVANLRFDARECGRVSRVQVAHRVVLVPAHPHVCWTVDGAMATITPDGDA
jgi:hypothetical protein